MPSVLSAGYERWKSHPRRYDILFLLGSPLRRRRNRRHAEKQRRQLLVPPIDTSNVEILTDPAFQASCAAARGNTLLDVARLANLWYLARLAGEGMYLEVGSYRGGGALHICNAVQHRRPVFYCFDPFEEGGFETIRSEDELFQKDQFTDTSYKAVVRLLAAHPNATAVKGFFPAAAQKVDLRDIAFCHLDVDVYEATRDGLEFLASRLAPRSLIVLDDMNRNVKGVQQAVEEFLRAHPAFVLLPMFPSQGVLLSTELWSAR